MSKIPNVTMSGPVAIQAAQGKTKSKAKTFDVIAYTGGLMTLQHFDLPLVVDLTGLGFRNSVVANLDHERNKRVGHVTDRSTDGGQLRLQGVLSAATPHRDEVLNSAADGFVWQASIEAQPHKLDNLSEGETVQVNGQTIEGPAYVVRSATLHGFAFVSHGADDNTEVAIAAKLRGLKTRLKHTADGKKLAAELYTKTVLACSRGQYLSPKVLRQVIALAGMTVEQFDQAVDTLSLAAAKSRLASACQARKAQYQRELLFGNTYQH